MRLKKMIKSKKPPRKIKRKITKKEYNFHITLMSKPCKCGHYLEDHINRKNCSICDCLKYSPI